MQEAEAIKNKKASSSSGSKSHSGAKGAAISLKAQARYPFWHAYRMYANAEDLQKEFIIADTTKALQDWYHRQTLELKGAESSLRWVQRRCKSEYLAHILDTISIMSSNKHFGRWGLEISWQPGDFADEGVDAHCEQQNEHTGYVADMIIGVYRSRLCWGGRLPLGLPPKSSIVSFGGRRSSCQ